MPNQVRINEMIAAGLSRRVAVAADAAGWDLEDLLSPASGATKAAFLALPNVGRTSWSEIETMRVARSPEGIKAARVRDLQNHFEAANFILDLLYEAEGPDAGHPSVVAGITPDGHVYAMSRVA